MAAKAKPPAFQLYPRDLLASTAGMNAEQFSAYIHLLLHAWDPPAAANGAKPPIGCLPNEPDLLAEKSEAGPRWPEVSRSVLRHFQLSDDGSVLALKWLIDERKKQRAYSKSMSENGKKGGRPRKPDETRGFPAAMPDATRGEAEKSIAVCGLRSAVGSNEPTDPSPAGGDVVDLSSKAAGRRRSARRAGKPGLPAALPMPFTIEQLLSALRETCKGQIIVDPFDKAYVKPLTDVIRALDESHCTLDDVRLAGEYAAVIVPTWQISEPLGVGWVATGGKLSTLIGKARAWHQRGRALAGGTRSTSGNDSVAALPSAARREYVPPVHRADAPPESVKETLKRMTGTGGESAC